MARDDVLDLSRYDSANIYDVSAVNDPDARDIIVNVEDPGCENKVAEAQRLGKGRGLYSWLYPGDGAGSAVRGQQMADRLARGGVALTKGVAIDYEQNGVSPNDATAARVRASQLPQPFHLYTYLYLLNSQPGLAAEWWQWMGRWIAYYPGNNDGSLPGWAIGDAQAWGAMLWQYTSTNGQRDRSTPVSDAWHTWGGGAAPAPEEDVQVDYITSQSNPGVGIWKCDKMVAVHVMPGEWAATVFANGGAPPVHALPDEWWDSIPKLHPDVTLTVRDLVNIQNVVRAA